MNQDRLKETDPIPTGPIILFTVLVFITVNIGFHATYTQYFPKFEKFNWLHHIHGALMACWTLLLVVQPILIRKSKFATHRFIGQLSYIIAPLIMASIFLVARFNYHHGITDNTPEAVFAKQSITWMQLFMFVLFYSLAIFYKKDTPKHMRFMIGTAIIMLGPGLSRTINAYFVDASTASYATLIPLYVKTALATALLLRDVIKKKNLMPYTIVLLAFLLADLAYYARHSDVWQGFGKFVINNLY